MAFNEMLGKARELTGSVSEAISKLLDEFNAAQPTLTALGFSVQDVQVGMGVFPEISAKLTARAADVDVKTLDELIEKKKDQKTLGTILKMLQTAYTVRDQLGDLGLNGVEIDLTLGLPPKVSVGFIKSAAASTSAAASAA